jgi:protein SCO1/2
MPDRPSDPGPLPVPRRTLWWGLSVVLVLLVAVVALEHRGRPANRLPRLRRVPAFELHNRNGATVRTVDLASSPWIGDFIFTTCPLSCPMMTTQMARLDHDLPGGPGLRLVSISVDPEHDTPAVLDRYARQAGASDRWLFLTGDRPAIQRLAEQGLALGMGGGGQTGAPITHSTRFFLVDDEGWVRGYYDSLDPAALRQLRDDTAALLNAR